MKQSVAFLGLLAIAGIAVFGILIMSREGVHHGCIASLARGVECADTPNAVQVLDFHSSAFKTFSTAVITLAFSLFALFTVIGIASEEKETQLFYRLSTSEPKVSSVRRVVRRWLSLHEKRDPSAAF